MMVMVMMMVMVITINYDDDDGDGGKWGDLLLLAASAGLGELLAALLLLRLGLLLFSWEGGEWKSFKILRKTPWAGLMGMDELKTTQLFI